MFRRIDMGMLGLPLVIAGLYLRLYFLPHDRLDFGEYIVLGYACLLLFIVSLIYPFFLRKLSLPTRLVYAFVCALASILALRYLGPSQWMI